MSERRIRIPGPASGASPEQRMCHCGTLPQNRYGRRWCAPGQPPAKSAAWARSQAAGAAVPLWSALALICVSAGCATHVAVLRPLSAAQVANLNETIGGKKATLQLAGAAQPVRARDLRLVDGTLRFQERDPASSWELSSWLPAADAPLASVRSI